MEKKHNITKAEIEEKIGKNMTLFLAKHIKTQFFKAKTFLKISYVAKIRFFPKRAFVLGS